MKSGEWVAVVGVIIVVAVLVSVVTANVTGKAIFNRLIRANSCDADSICEVQGTISSTNPLKFSSNSGVAKLESDLTLTKLGQSGGTQFITNSEGSLTIIPQSGYAKLLAALTLSGNNYQGGVVLKSNEAGSLTITPQSGAVKLEGYLSVTNLTGNGTAYVCVNSGGVIYRSLTACR